MLKFRIFLVLFFLLSTAGAFADPISQDDLAWLKKIVTATHQTNFIGTFIYQSGSYIETSRITHVLDGENEYERLEGLDGERSEIIRKNDQVWCYLGDNKLMVAKLRGARTFPALLPEELSSLHENYSIRHGEVDRVSGFHAHSIIFQPRDKMRYTHKMWVDSDTALLLRAVVMDGHKHVIEQYSFTQLNIGGHIDRSWIPSNTLLAQINPKKSSKPASGSDTHSPPVESGWRVYALPVGFKKVTEVSRHLRGSDLPVTHLVFSDGLAGISVFIETMTDKPELIQQGLHSRGVIQIFTKILDNHLLTVVGEVPPHTVMQVAESVRYRGH